MNTKETVTLTKEQETLLIPLYARAQERALLQDEKAGQILSGVQYDFRQLKVPRKTVVTLGIRSLQLDAWAANFLADHPNALVLHLGCGLDSRCLRLPHPGALWVDLDLPDVIALRRKFYAETASDRMLASSVTELAWMEQVPAGGRPVLVIAEGLLMYLHEPEVRQLILCLQQHYPGCELVFDAFSELTTRRIQAHPSLQKTGASIHWGIDDPHAIEGWGPGIRLVEEWFFSQSPAIARLDWFYRFMFRLTASIPAAQKAQRLLYYKL